MAKTSFTSVGSSANSPEPLLRPSPATDHEAEILDVEDRIWAMMLKHSHRVWIREQEKRSLDSRTGETAMNRFTLVTLQLVLVAVTTLTASHWKISSQTAGAAQEQTAGSGKVEERENTLGADQANKVSNTGVDVPETQAIEALEVRIDPEGADPRSESNFSFDTEKDPPAVSGTQN
jgi:hypothetical protein